jgi:hypothetical protein
MNVDLTGCGRKRSWPNLRQYLDICPDGLRGKKTEKPLRIAGRRAENVVIVKVDGTYSYH